MKLSPCRVWSTSKASSWLVSTPTAVVLYLHLPLRLGADPSLAPESHQHLRSCELKSSSEDDDIPSSREGPSSLAFRWKWHHSHRGRWRTRKTLKRQRKRVNIKDCSTKRQGRVQYGLSFHSVGPSRRRSEAHFSQSTYGISEITACCMREDSRQWSGFNSSDGLFYLSMDLQPTWTLKIPGCALVKKSLLHKRKETNHYLVGIPSSLKLF